jgi:ketosteroid isomerase-like protein
MPERDEERVREVIETERRWVQAHRDLDLATIDGILAEDYVQIRPDGSLIGKVDLLESYGSGNRHWDVAESDQYQVNVLGDAAVLVGRWTGRGVNAGEAFDYTARFMAVYARRNGKWLLVADQSMPLSSEPAP